MKCRTLVFLEGSDGDFPVGTVIDHPEAFKLVRRGLAEPADRECARAVGVPFLAKEAKREVQDGA